MPLPFYLSWRILHQNQSEWRFGGQSGTEMYLVHGRRPITKGQPISFLTPASIVVRRGRSSCAMREARNVPSAETRFTKWGVRSRRRGSQTGSNGKRFALFGLRAFVSGASGATPRPNRCRSDCGTLKISFNATQATPCARCASVAFRPIADISRARQSPEMDCRIALPLFAALATSGNAQVLAPPAGGPPSIVPSVGPLSLHDLTENISVIGCRIESVDGSRHEFVIKYVGGRGYLDPVTSEASSTDGKISVIEDESALLATYSKWFRRGDNFEAFSEHKGAALGPRLRLALERTEVPNDRAEGRWAVLVQAYSDWMPLAKATGFCDVRRTPQQPLNEAETRAYLKR